MKKILVVNQDASLTKMRKHVEEKRNENELLLKERIIAACEEHGYQATPELLAAALVRFTLVNDKVKPMSVYDTIEDFLKRHNHNAPSLADVTKRIDDRIMKKKNLYQEMVTHAERGDVKSYREVRKELFG